MKTRGTIMMRRVIAGSVLCLLMVSAPATRVLSQERGKDPVYRVEVDLVMLTVAVTDKGGKYIKGLRPTDLRILEDGIPQKVSMFGEGGGKPENIQVLEERERASRPLPTVAPGSNVFILFDTSNFMYKGFVFAQDAIADFIRSLDSPDSVAVYSFSRNLLRASPLTPDRRNALLGLRQTVAGDDTSLYNALLLTLQDASRVPGRKVVVVFSNGPDNASMVSPEAVREFAENEGIPIYLISTQELSKDDISSTVFQRLSSRTGGKTYFARNWRKQNEAFHAIREDLAHLYLLGYYPAPNANSNWRSITVDLVGDQGKKFRIRTRSGYRPKHRGGAEQQMISGSGGMDGGGALR
jgi:Ca-activated chloride channel homolog